MAKLGQEYKQGIIVQRSETGSAFQESMNVEIEQRDSIEASLNGGIKEVNVETTVEEGKPLEFATLPSASAEYKDLFCKVSDSFYLCQETSSEVFEWIEYAEGAAGEPDYFCVTPIDDSVDIGWGVEIADIETSTFVPPTLYYSTDKATWTEYEWTQDEEGYYIEPYITISSPIYWKGDNETFNSSDGDYIFLSATDNSSIGVSGNIMTLVDSTGRSKTIPCDYCFYELFGSLSGLTSVKNLKLPATRLTPYCYSCMFYQCTALTEAPELPATTLAEGCYASMFNFCEALTEAPELPALVVADYAYDMMFYNTALEHPPVLPATEVGEGGYMYMFKNCQSLISLPELPATILGGYCYGNMFSECPNIKLSATQTGDYISAYRIPANGTGVAESDSTREMFSNTGGTFTDDPEVNVTYYTSNDIVHVNGHDVVVIVDPTATGVGVGSKIYINSLSGDYYYTDVSNTLGNLLDKNGNIVSQPLNLTGVKQIICESIPVEGYEGSIGKVRVNSTSYMCEVDGERTIIKLHYNSEVELLLQYD